MMMLIFTIVVLLLYVQVLQQSLFVNAFVVPSKLQQNNNIVSSSSSSSWISSSKTTIQQQYQQKRRRSLSPSFTSSTTSGSSNLLINKMVSYDDLIEKLPSTSVINAIEKKSSSGNNKVIASDVAASAGVSLSQARKDLTALASITQGDIAVSSDGELIYTFPSNINSVLSSNSAKYKALSIFQKQIWPKLFYGIRVGFGLALIASLVAIYSTIIFISSSSSRSDDDRDRGGGSSFGGSRGGFGGFGGFWGPSPFDFFYYRPYYGYYGRPISEQYRDPDDLGFLESTFSYIFGDGNPNQNIDELRLSLVSNMIRQNKGAVTAEQLAPFCDDAPTPSVNDKEESTFVDESFVLPIVTKLGGEPSVTDDGDIIYLFPDLQQTSSSSNSNGDLLSSWLTSPSSSSAASEIFMLKRAGLKPNASPKDIKRLLEYNGISTRSALDRQDLLDLLKDSLPPPSEEEEKELVEADPSLLQEREYKFSLANDGQKLLAGGLGVVNLGGALYLGNMFSEYARYGVQLPSYFGLVQSAFPFLLSYAILFNIIPLVRSFWIDKQNTQIRNRNKIRQMWKSALESKNVTKIARKIKAASKMGIKMKQLGASGSSKDIIFDTSKPMEENQKKKEKDDLKEFDRLLLEKNSDTSSFQ